MNTKKCEGKSEDGSFLSDYTLWWDMLILGMENRGCGQSFKNSSQMGELLGFGSYSPNEHNVNQTRLN